MHATLTVIMCVGVLILAYILQPIVHPKPLYTSCPVDPSNHLICGGYTTCSGTSFLTINGTNTCTSGCFCDCPIDRDGNACEIFAYGMPVAIFVTPKRPLVGRIEAWSALKTELVAVSAGWKC